MPCSERVESRLPPCSTPTSMLGTCYSMTSPVLPATVQQLLPTASLPSPAATPSAPPPHLLTRPTAQPSTSTTCAFSTYRSPSAASPLSVRRCPTTACRRGVSPHVSPSKPSSSAPWVWTSPAACSPTASPGCDGSGLTAFSTTSSGRERNKSTALPTPHIGDNCNKEKHNVTKKRRIPTFCLVCGAFAYANS